MGSLFVIFYCLWIELKQFHLSSFLMNEILKVFNKYNNYFLWFWIVFIASVQYAYTPFSFCKEVVPCITIHPLWPWFCICCKEHIINPLKSFEAFQCYPDLLICHIKISNRYIHWCAIYSLIYYLLSGVCCHLLFATHLAQILPSAFQNESINCTMTRFCSREVSALWFCMSCSFSCRMNTSVVSHGLSGRMLSSFRGSPEQVMRRCQAGAWEPTHFSDLRNELSEEAGQDQPMGNQGCVCDTVEEIKHLHFLYTTLYVHGSQCGAQGPPPVHEAEAFFFSFFFFFSGGNHNPSLSL